MFGSRPTTMKSASSLYGSGSKKGYGSAYSMRVAKPTYTIVEKVAVMIQYVDTSPRK